MGKRPDNRTLHEQAVAAIVNCERDSGEDFRDEAERFAGAVLGVVRQAIRDLRDGHWDPIDDPEWRAVRDEVLTDVLALFPEEQQREPQEHSKEGSA